LWDEIVHIVFHVRKKMEEKEEEKRQIKDVETGMVSR
jgi:hypothetical protein